MTNVLTYVHTMTILDRDQLAILTEISCAQFDGEDAPCSRGLLAHLERWSLVHVDGAYATLTALGWNIVTALEAQSEEEVVLIREGGRLRALGRFRVEERAAGGPA